MKKYIDKTPTMIDSMPVRERPRERLLRDGVEGLSTAELLAISIRTGVCGRSAIDIAHELLTTYKGLRGLADVSIVQLKKVRGLGCAKVAQIKAIFELSYRLREEVHRVDHQYKVVSAEDIVGLVGMRVRDRVREHFWVVLLNAQNRLISSVELSVGTVDRAYPIVREILLHVLEMNAAGFVCVHNHPSGNPEPSPHDIIFTRDLDKSSKLMQINMIDHIIIAGDGYVSLAERGVL